VIIATDKVCKEGSKYCPVPKTNGHDTKECKVLLAQVKKMPEKVTFSKMKSANQMRTIPLMMTYLMHSISMTMSATKMKQMKTLMKRKSAVA
jgi:hypothetical protein